MDTIIFAILWAQPNGGGGAALGELIKLIIFLLIIVGPILLRFLQEQGAKKNQKKLDDREMQKQLHDAFSSTSIEEEPAVSTRSKRERKRKRVEPVASEPLPSTVALSRQLAPQGEGARFEARPGTLVTGTVLTPTVEPTVQPMLDSLTGIYDETSQSVSQQAPLAAELFHLLSTPTGIRQAVVLGEILKRPEY